MDITDLVEETVTVSDFVEASRAVDGFVTCVSEVVADVHGEGPVPDIPVQVDGGIVDDDADVDDDTGWEDEIILFLYTKNPGLINPLFSCTFFVHLTKLSSRRIFSLILWILVRWVLIS